MKRFIKSLIRALINAVCILGFIGNVCIAKSNILATVEENIITTNNLEKRYLALIKTNNLSPTPDEIRMLKLQLLHSLINEKVIMNEAKRLKIKITDEDISSAIANIERSQNFPKGSFIQHHEQYGITKDDLWEQMRVKLAWQKILTDFIIPVYGQNSVSDKELNEFIIQNYPESIKVDGFIYKFDRDNFKSLKKLHKINRDSLCNIKALKELTGYAPAKVSSILERIKNPKIRQIASFAQETPGIVTTEDKGKTIVLVLCKKRPTISEKELNQMKEELKNKKMERYTEHYLKNLKKKMAIKINDVQYIHSR